MISQPISFYYLHLVPGNWYDQIPTTSTKGHGPFIGVNLIPLFKGNDIIPRIVYLSLCVIINKKEGEIFGCTLQQENMTIQAIVTCCMRNRNGRRFEDMLQKIIDSQVNAFTRYQKKGLFQLVLTIDSIKHTLISSDAIELARRNSLSLEKFVNLAFLQVNQLEFLFLV